jgi:hypothetical protein
MGRWPNASLITVPASDGMPPMEKEVQLQNKWDPKMIQ